MVQMEKNIEDKTDKAIGNVNNIINNIHAIPLGKHKFLAEVDEVCYAPLGYAVHIYVKFVRSKFISFMILLYQKDLILLQKVQV